MFNLEKSHFGYWSVGDYKTFSKLEALEIHIKLNQPIKYHFNDEVYGAVDWGQEPAQSLTEMYFERARQIRAKYDYVVLFFSGGADSYNALQAFVHAGVKIDEIASLSYAQADRSKTSFMNREIYETSLPIAHRLKEQNPLYKDLVIREIDLSEHTRNVLTNNLYDSEYFGNTVPSPWRQSGSMHRDLIPEYKKLCSEKRVVFVYGHEKISNVKFERGKFYFAFHELTSSMVDVRTQYLNRPTDHDEYFYSTPDAPLIHVKQGHAIKNFLKTAPADHPWLSRTKISPYGHIPKWHEGRWQTHWLTYVGLHSIVYPWFDPAMYVTPKIQNMVFSDRDTWVYNDPVLGAKYRSWVSSMMKKFGNKWMTIVRPGVAHTGHHFGTTYCLGK